MAQPPVEMNAKRYLCFDFQLSSDLDLPELRAVDGACSQNEEVVVRLDHVPERLGTPTSVTTLQRGDDGEALLTIAGIARFLISKGRHIAVDPDPRASERSVRAFLLGSALGILCHQRRLLPLHANAVVIDGRAAAFAGDSGAGKSTLAAHFQKAGHEVLCDDVCVVSLDSEGRPWAWPGIPRVKLWGDAATAVGHDLESLAPALDGRDKYLAPIDPQGEHRPVPLVGLYLLQRAQEGAVSEVSRLTGQSAVEAVMQHTYRPNFVRALGLQAQHFQLSASLAAATGVYTAPRAWGFDVFAAEAERIERHVRDARPTMC